MRSILQWQRDVYQCAVDHGFYQNDDGAPIDVRHPLMLSSRIALIHSEIDEAHEAQMDGDVVMRFEVSGKPEGMIVELADAAIRCLDFAGSLNLDLSVAQKQGYEIWKGFQAFQPLTIHLSASRALEAVRDGRITTVSDDGVPVHLAAIVSQCERSAAYFGCDLWEAVEKKHEYNLKRPYKHGRKSL